MNGLGGAARIQRRVIWALMLREMKTLFGKHKLGYLWALINATWTIGIFWGIRELAGFRAPHGLSNPVFLLGGFIPWYLFSESAKGAMNAIGGNRAILAYPQVFPLDLIVARTLLQGAMYLCVMTFLLLASRSLGEQVALHDPLVMLAGLFLALLLGLGVGLLFSAFNLMWPTTERLVPMLLRIMFFVSGLFFSVDNLPLAARKLLFFNPLSHLIEMVRGGMSAGYASSFVYLPYPVGFILLALTLGLLLERYSRKYLDSAS